MSDPAAPGVSRRRRRVDAVREALVLDSDGLGTRVAKGAGFTFAGIVLRTLITLASTAALARLLTPSDFGLLAMATVVTELVALFGGFGLSNILIQQRVITRLQVDTVFWSAAGVGIALAMLTFFVSFLAGWFFSDPHVGEMLRLLCLGFAVGGLGTVQDALLVRRLRFRTQFLIETTVVAARSLAAITAAALGLGAWSLVVGSLSGTVISVLLVWAVAPYIPRPRFHGRYLLRTWRTSGSYLGNGLLYYVNMNSDLALVGRFLGADALGYYQNARSLTDEIRGRIAMPLQRVLFPAFSTLQGDRDWLQRSVVRAGSLLAAVVVPIGVGIAAVAPDLVPVLYGSQWLSMVPVLSLFGFSGALRGATAIASPLFNSQNQVALALRYNTLGTLVVIATVLLSLPYGLVAVAAGVAIASTYSLVTFRVAFRLIGLGSRDVARVLVPPVFCALVMWGAILLSRDLAMQWIASRTALLVVHIGLGAAVYVAALHLWSREYFREFWALAGRLAARSQR